MRKSLVFLAFVLLFTSLTGCSKKDALDPSDEMPYEIIEENGNCYLIINNSVAEKVTESIDPMTIGPTICFETIDEMVNDIQTGNFTENELATLNEFPKDDLGRIQIVNLSELYTPTLPASLISKRIIWSRSGYQYILGCENEETHHSMRLCSREKYEEAVEKASRFAEITKCEIHSVTTEPDRNATVTVYVDGLGQESKKVYYTISEGSKTLHVAERYVLDKSYTVPTDIFIYGTDNGVSFYFYLNPLTERPSVEWLSQFGVREYVETEVA